MKKVFVLLSQVRTGTFRLKTHSDLADHVKRCHGDSAQHDGGVGGLEDVLALVVTLEVDVRLLDLTFKLKKHRICLASKLQFLPVMCPHSLSYFNGTVCFKNVYKCLNTSIYSYLETSGGQSSNLYLNAVCFLNTSVN